MPETSGLSKIFEKVLLMCKVTGEPGLAKKVCLDDKILMESKDFAANV